MRQRLLLTGLLLLAVVVPASLPSAEITKGPLAPGKNVPATFHPYNVTARVIPAEEREPSNEKEDREKEKEKEKDKDKPRTPPYTSKGKYHCLITEYDLDPVVMLFARGLEDSEGFRELLKKLDDSCTKNRPSRLRAFVVFLSDKLTNVAAQDEERDEMVRKIQKIQDALKLSNVVLTVAATSDLAKYQLDEAAALTVVMYRNLSIKASRTELATDLEKADSPAIKTTLSDVTDKLLPRR